MADDPKDICRKCGYSRKEHMTTSKNRSVSKLRKKKGPGETYPVSFHNCDRFDPESKK